MDVNGQAAGIELYLGRRALTADGQLRPVRWGGYVSSVRKYQGEVEDKGSVMDAFVTHISTLKDPAEAKREYPDLVRVWRHIFHLVENQAAEGIIANYERQQEE